MLSIDTRVIIKLYKNTKITMPIYMHCSTKSCRQMSITRRCVQILCVNGRIEGTIKVENLGLILKAATKPVVDRLLRDKKIDFSNIT